MPLVSGEGTEARLLRGIQRLVRGIRTQLGSAQHGSHNLSERRIPIGSMACVFSGIGCTLEGAQFCMNGEPCSNRNVIVMRIALVRKRVVEHLRRVKEFARKRVDELLWRWHWERRKGAASDQRDLVRQWWSCTSMAIELYLKVKLPFEL